MGTISRAKKPIAATSFSRVKNFKQCQKRAYLAYVLKIPEAERPALPAGKEYANDRGSRIHDECEEFVKGKRLQPIEAKYFKDELERIREIKAKSPQRVLTEDMWCFDKDWRWVPSNDFSRIWLRVILDVIVFVSDTEAIVIDYKTGRRVGNEVDHAQQMQLYQLIAFMLFPSLQVIHTELWYLDQDEIATMTFNRKQGKRFYLGFNTEFTKMTSTLVFKSNPSRHTCRFCPYKTGDISKKQGTVGTGDCDENIEVEMV